jgi:sRNA-binding carbon storage regulator CsrA
MALILSAREGESVYVGDRKVTVTEIYHATHFKVCVVDEFVDAVFTIRASERTEILPDVFLSAGNTGNAHAVKLVFEAPSDRVILRERLYQRGSR